MAVVAKHTGKALIVRLEGELDLHSVEPFKEVVAEAFAADESLRHLILKMNAVTFMDSSGVGAILGRYREIRERGGTMALIGLQAPVRKVFDLSGMARLIAVFDSEREALADLTTR